MAAPHVTGTVAAMFEAAGRRVSIQEIRDCLKRSAKPVTDVGHDYCCAWGWLDTAGAIREIRGVKVPRRALAPQGRAHVRESPATTFEPAIFDDVMGDFASASQGQAAEVPLEEGALMPDAANRFLDRAERALRTSYAGRRESETLFLQRLFREIGCNPNGGLSPAELFRTVLRDEALKRGAQSFLSVVGIPLKRPEDALRAGDWILRVALGTGDVGHVSVLASDALVPPSGLASEGITAESAQPGYYGLVIEAGAFPHSRSRPFARRLLDSHGRVPRNTVVLRPKYSDFGAQTGPLSDEPEPSIMPSSLVEAPNGSPKTFAPEDLAQDMVGLDCVLVSPYKTNDGRSLAAGSTVRITAWDNTKEAIDGTIAGSAISIPKELLAPKAAMYTATYTSRLTQREVAIPLYVTDAPRLRAAIVDGKVKGTDQRNNYKQLNKHLLIEVQLNRFDHYLAAYTGHYNATIGEPNGWAPLVPGWVKSMMIQESIAGSAGVYLVEVPGFPPKNRFNVLQAIDSWGPQQFIMIQEIEPESLKKSGFDKVMDDQRTLEEEWQRLDALTRRSKAQSARLNELDRLRFADIVSRTSPTWSTFYWEYPNVAMKAGAKTGGTSGKLYRDFVFKFLSAGSPPRKDDYRFWIQTGIRWLFEKRQTTSNWSDAVRAYNGTGGRAEFYRAIVLTRARAAAAAAGIDEPIWGGLYCRPGTKTMDGNFNLCAFERVANPCEPRC
jgi:hypothetical protein